jgi:hypothetical protein
MRSFALVALASLLVTCGPKKSARDQTPDPEPTAAEGEAEGEGETSGSGSAVPAGQGDAPEISRSVGKKGGAVIFWTRVIPRTDDTAIHDVAAKLQARAVATAKKALGDKPLDVRPEPERVCPREGCEAMTFGVLLVHAGGGCSALALVSAPGKSAIKIVPWGGLVDLKQTEVPFREHPESQVTVKDAVPCTKLLEQLDAKEADVTAAVTAAASG